VWEALGGDDEEVLREYEITEDDVDGPFVDEIPGSFEEMAEMDRLLHGPEELLAEKFHMSIEVLRQLNPDADFSQAGTGIVVAAVPEDRLMRANVGEESGQDRPRGTRSRPGAGDAHRGGQGDGSRSGATTPTTNLLVAYPATIGSEQFPSPSGTTEVVVVVRDPNYTYTPESDVEGPDEALQLPPGPQRAGGLDLDRPREGGLRHPRHLRPGQHPPPAVPWLRAADQLGRRGTGRAGRGGDGGVRRSFRRRRPSKIAPIPFDFSRA
jgi:hypothetical protein